MHTKPARISADQRSREQADGCTHRGRSLFQVVAALGHAARAWWNRSSYRDPRRVARAHDGRHAGDHTDGEAFGPRLYNVEGMSEGGQPIRMLVSAMDVGEATNKATWRGVRVERTKECHIPTRGTRA